MKNLSGTALLLSMLLWAGIAIAADTTDTDRPSDMPPPQGEQGQTGKRPPIPQFAIDACVGKKSGDVCTAGKAKGVCLYTPDKKYFACKPDFMKIPPDAKNTNHQGPPTAD